MSSLHLKGKPRKFPFVYVRYKFHITKIFSILILQLDSSLLHLSIYQSVSVSVYPYILPLSFFLLIYINSATRLNIVSSFYLSVSILSIYLSIYLFLSHAFYFSKLILQPENCFLFVPLRSEYQNRNYKTRRNIEKQKKRSEGCGAGCPR